MNKNDYPALKNLHKMLKHYVDVMTVDGRYVGDVFGLETYERLDMFLNSGKKEPIIFKIGEKP